MKHLKKKRILESAFKKVPLFSKISTKLIILIILLSAVPLLLVSYFFFNSYRDSLEHHITEDFELMAESQEGHLLTFLESMKGRVVDFSSDGFIRDLVQNTINNPENLTEITDTLNKHLIFNKMSLDKDIYGINVINLDGEIIASTESIEIGKDERDDDYFINTIRLSYGDAFISDVHFSRHFAKEERSIITSAPLTNKNTGETIGIIVNYYKTSTLDDVLSGKQALELGAISGLKGRPDTLDIYLVNKDGLMISESKFLGKDVFLKQVANTKPVVSCISNNEEISGVWTDYRGVQVYGASMCMPDFGWTLLVEIDEEKVVEPILILRRTMFGIVFFITLLIIILGIYFSRMLTSPFEEVTKVAEKISEGDLTVRANVQSKDEAGILSQSFNNMTNRLIKARRFPENIIKSMGEALMLISPEGNIQEINPATYEMLGYEKGELVGKSIEKLFVPKENGKNGDNLEKIIKKGFLQNVEMSFLTKNKKEISVKVSGSIMKDENSKLIGTVIVFHDITAEKAIDRAKSEFISVASHQLRTPMTGIQWVIERILKKETGLSEEGKTYLQDLHISSVRLAELVDALLNVSRIESAGGISVTPEKIDLIHYTQEFIKELGPLLAKKDIDISFNHPKELSIKTDPKVFRNIIQSVVSNAIEYTPEKGSIDISMEKKDGRVFMEVKDTGIGIPYKDKAKIFEKFHRAENAKMIKTDGTGLGLYIAKTATKVLGGKIGFTSVEDKGTTFFVDLPLEFKEKGGEKKLL
jgi:two-component system, OmpR family, phosphate regulon sensor histidine kinase PhoR